MSTSKWRNIYGPVLPNYLSQWTFEKVEAEDVYVLPKANVEGVSLEDNKVALTLNDDQKVIDYFNTCFSDVYKNLKIISANLNWPFLIAQTIRIV